MYIYSHDIGDKYIRRKVHTVCNLLRFIVVGKSDFVW